METSSALRSDSTSRRGTSPGSVRCRRKFLRVFPGGFGDPTYLDWERNYKVAAHRRWEESLGKTEFRTLLRRGRGAEASARAVAVESRTHLLFSFEKMALRDALRSDSDAQVFAEGLFGFVYGGGPLRRRFDRWADVVASLPHERSRVLTWPVVTVFGFLARPEEHFFFKPNVTRRAAHRYGVELPYRPRPSSDVYEAVLAFAETVRRDLKDLGPRDMIDIQSFLWIQGSDEYA